MRRSLFFIIFGCLVAFMPLAVVAEDPVAAHLQLISQHCTQIHALIDQLQRRDLVARTNIGREYESIDKQLDAFTQRVRNNNINSQGYQQFLTQFRDATTQFRDAYVRYDDSINKLQAVSCQQHPEVFDQQLTVSRNLRDDVEGNITHISAIIGQYRDLVAQLPSQLPTIQNSGVAQ